MIVLNVFKNFIGKKKKLQRDRKLVLKKTVKKKIPGVCQHPNKKKSRCLSTPEKKNPRFSILGSHFFFQELVTNVNTCSRDACYFSLFFFVSTFFFLLLKKGNSKATSIVVSDSSCDSASKAFPVNGIARLSFVFQV